MASIAYDPENVFLKIIRGDLPSYKLFETEHVVAILDAFPTVPGHALLLPKAPGFATVMDMPPEVAASVFKELPRLASAVQSATGADGVNVVQNNGAAAGQVVFHAHIHVIPRFKNDGLLTLPSGPAMISKEDGEAMQAKIQHKL
ncbi:Histidine triad nucleotide-binding protein 2, mitochondrial [Phytophthora pseudosyringae]|uniref:Histidine triad nucleotide-binding protein 2, mitochondrial n=1 Tax=Phytophthora pseudosyringae TaxID=221518 RepID=A0A8T1VG13_9STRA|nr:Histidine triad nucleotide-binding protein 2, mitochondrial [Phytophthora pseudosyringae]